MSEPERTTPDDVPQVVIDAAKALGPLTKVTVNFTARSVDALKAAAEQTGLSRTDTLNQAIQMYAHIVQIHDEGNGSARLVWHDAPGAAARIDVNRSWWRFW
jgi:hypothetical protein